MDMVSWGPGRSGWAGLLQCLAWCCEQKPMPSTSAALPTSPVFTMVCLIEDSPYRPACEKRVGQDSLHELWCWGPWGNLKRRPWAGTHGRASSSRLHEASPVDSQKMS